jgi:hypothetical protein
MNSPRPFSMRWQWIGAVIAGAVMTSACAPKTAGRQTDIMEQSGKVSVSAAVLRARVNDLVERVAGRIEMTADRISAETDDALLRRRALVLKMDAIPAVYTAGFRADPLVAVVDVWGFAFQFSQYMENRAGQNGFGLKQPLVQECARALLADTDAVIRAIAIRPEYFDQTRAQVEGWARSHPVQYAFSARESGASLVTDLRSGDRDVFLDVGTISDVVESLSERVNTYAALLPRQARWQAEILIGEVASASAHRIDGALGDIHDIGTAARGAVEVVENLPDLLNAERNMLADERRAVLAGIQSQRLETLEYMTVERQAVIAAARKELIALVAALRQERIDSLTEVDAIKTRAIDSVLAGMKDLVDYTLWRVAALTFCLLLAAAALGAIAYRLGRRRPSLAG